ncbi:MAG: dihydroneopterin aldolase [Bacteroidales bacterium]|nr:dihydroneopterin aldolase [Bacteroidales bacterium]
MKISLNGMRFYAYHGFYEVEQKVGGWYSVDVTAEPTIKEAGKDDELSQTINYEIIYNTVKTEMSKKSKLIEHVALRTLHALEQTLPTATALTVRIHKLNPPLGGEVKEAVVEIQNY